ncbi:FAD-dependent 5-carboxymethylaminomethyl-2-thiouridine(34) oxidoreductase MnmC [Guyparkeria halophila]|uniref:tRNA 5-methylaminomethyl-2-thiouridine biosynthesis bifunctional protein MnmC n=1 Tax=Guyparkeria halophila TaxID=47960 RepID=A0ABZ0YU66_9GAMM|nr:FAD-dependent 5-carboxymethylaminomethyl-2-thiouridine(34) oxidoreductase MnmC [Guyparkeria halophila]WQH15546.1 FAD-dependent 5-carboxymethylaminomethyl-2-thiouridine(34) oxidoreductase MnmC [Guyparkeria halophila]
MTPIAGGGPLVPAELAWRDDGTVHSEAFGGLDFPRAGAFAESEHVFLAGNDLYARFAQDPGQDPGQEQGQAQGQKPYQCNRILEAGFGTGGNFLATALLFLELAPPQATLDFVSLEAHPVAAVDLPRLGSAQQRAAQQWLADHPRFPIDAHERFVDLQSALHAQWPDPVPGFHRRLFADGRIRLTLVWGDPAIQTPRIDGRFDAFYLDGYGPDGNPESPQEPVIQQLGRLSAPGATAAVAHAAPWVRERLTAAGFVVQQPPGFARDEAMLSARRHDGPEASGVASRRTEGPVAILGAGMAGTTVARALNRRGREVVVFEAGSAPAGGGSGNPAGLVAPVISRDWNRLSQLTATGMGFMRAELAELVDGETAAFDGVIKLARSERHVARQAGIAAELQPDPGFAQWCEAASLRGLTGVTDIDSPGWYFPTAGWLRPRPVIAHWLAAPGIETRLDRSVQRLLGAAGAWRVQTTDGRTHGPFAEVIVAAGPSSGALIEALRPWIEPCRGQVSWGRHGGERSGDPVVSRRPLMREGYALDLPSGERLFGASFLPGDTELAVREDEHEGNRHRLAAIAPSLELPLSRDGLQGRASLRATTPDRLPIVGQVADGLWVSTGHGARGLTWSAWLGEYLAAQIEQTPSPLPRDLAEGLRPQRFDERAAHKQARQAGNRCGRRPD